MKRAWALVVIGMFGLAGSTLAAETNALTLHTRSRAETSPGSNRFHVTAGVENWDPQKTAIVICDMWDKHWCQGATRRVAEMAPRVNDVIRAARAKGILIIHAPSDTMRVYEGTPERKLAQSAPKAEGRPLVPERCALSSAHEPALPIDFSDDGCDCVPQCKHGSPWRRQIQTIQIEPGDAVTDSGEAYDLMRERGIDNVIIMGVHANICVLGRPFGIRQLAKLGQRVVLMRDLTDTMYNSRRPPYVNHFTGNDLVIEHIEKYWCPTVTSTDFLATAPQRFSEDKRPHLAVVVAEDEYDANTIVPAFAYPVLGRDFKLSFVFGDDKSKQSIPGLEILKEADAALLYVRRRTPKPEQLAFVREFVAAGKPVIGLRTSSHAFATRDNQTPPAGTEVWPTFDTEVFGGNYHGHHGNKGDLQTIVWAVSEQSGNPILTGVNSEETAVASWLYKTSPLKAGTTILMMGKVPNRKPDEPVTWTFTRKDGGRSFYTSLGNKEDLETPAFRRLIYNGICWALDREIPTEWNEPPASTAQAPFGLGDRIVRRLQQELATPRPQRP